MQNPEFKRTESAGQIQAHKTSAEADSFKAAVGLSRKWGAREAGREVARDTLEKLGKNPDFFLLFSTIHYEKHGGFQEFLNGVWDVLPKGTPLIGGTVAGFMNPQGCYTRGATALAVNYPNMDVAVGVGRNTKRDPQKAAKECAEMIKNTLDKSKYTNKFILTLISGSMILQVPGIGRRRVLGDISSKIAKRSYNLSLQVLQKGSGREDEILKNLTKKLSDFNLLSGSLMDDYKLVSNYQFFNKKIFENSIVSLAIASDMCVDIDSSTGMSPTGITFNVTKISEDNHIIDEIDGKPAVPHLLKLLNWPLEYFDERLYKKVWHYPLTFIDENSKQIPIVLGLILGKSIFLSYRVKNSRIEINTISGRNMLDAVDNILIHKDKNPLFGLISDCGARLGGLGYAVFEERRRLLQYFKDAPFISFYVAGEGIYIPSRGLSYGNETVNIAIFSKR